MPLSASFNHSNISKLKHLVIEESKHDLATGLSSGLYTSPGPTRPYLQHLQLPIYTSAGQRWALCEHIPSWGPCQRPDSCPCQLMSIVWLFSGKKKKTMKKSLPVRLVIPCRRPCIFAPWPRSYIPRLQVDRWDIPGSIWSWPLGQL